MAFRVGIDVGGTFTDFALTDDANGVLRMGKVLTTPEDPSLGVLQGLDAMAADAGVAVADIAEAVHATTIATNTVIQRNGPATALLTTEGFRDVLLIGRQKRWELYDNFIDKPLHVIRRRHIWEVPERMTFDGKVLLTLDEEAVRAAARAMVAAGIKAVSVCFLHSYANDAHERRAGEILAEEAPSLSIALSSQVSPVYREYERASTTALNAYLMPAVSSYVRLLQEGLADRGYRRPLFIMQSNGGVATPDVVQQFPIRIIESGPAAGVLTAMRYAEAAGTDNLLSFDMGGTTAKVCLIESGVPSLTGQFEVDMVKLKKNSGLPINIPAIDLVEIGSGGGSIARVEMGAIAVGPESASSVPGPICYGRGGTKPTVTDADLVLGYLNPDYFLGGEMKLDLDGAAKGIERVIGAPLGIDVVQAAWGIHEIVTAQMAQAARVVTVGRGKDPRHFAFIPFGGAGPVHGARLARMLGCPRIVFATGAGVKSAIGLLVAEASFDLARTSIMGVDAEAISGIAKVFGDLEVQGREQLAACGISGEAGIRRSADMRFVGQGYEINVPLDGRELTDTKKLRQAFFDAYGEAYGDRAVNPDDRVEIVHFRLTATAPTRKARKDAPAARSAGLDRAVKGERPVYFPETDGYAKTPVYDRYLLGPGDRIHGPAIIEERESTAVILPQSVATVDDEGNIVVDLEATELGA
jgi:N-methylhydantoinase A